MAQRRRLFVGSASESKHVAQTLLDELNDPTCEAKLWTHAFDLGRHPIHSLRDAVDRSDFAVFVFTPDDRIDSRGLQQGIPRDNVIFEFGMFMQKLGETRCYVVRPEEGDVKALSDFEGMTYASYFPPATSDTDSPDWNDALSSAARKIRYAMKRALKEEAATEPADRPLLETLQTTAVGTSDTESRLVLQLMIDAQRGVIPRVTSVSRGMLVIHPLHGLGQVRGSDPVGSTDRLIRVQFATGAAEVPLGELFVAGAPSIPLDRQGV